ncbi:MAG: endonuclease/exonuclease/phosphatase family protein [Myxococcota bacterium]
MSVFRVCFWNVQNLFEVGTVNRGPQSDAEMAAKLERIGGVLMGAFGAAPSDLPDIIGLAEVHTERLARDVAERLPGPYDLIWSPPPPGQLQTGLALLVRRAIASHTTWLNEYRPSIGSRPRVMLAEIQLALPNAPTILVAVNHWKSRMQHAGSAMTPDQDRNETATWLGDFLAERDKYDSVIVMGDFNAEPWEPPFGEFRLRGKRTFSGALWSRSTPAYLYNTAWRFAAEPDLWENKVAAGGAYQEGRPKNTYAGTDSILDHLLVSRALLRNGPLTLVEGTVTYVTAPPAGHHSAQGNLQPHRWSFDPNTGNGEGAADHFPLIAQFQTQREPLT